METIKKSQFSESELKGLKRETAKDPSESIQKKVDEIKHFCAQYFGTIREDNTEVRVNINAGKILHEKTKELSDFLTDLRKDLKDGIEIIEKVKEKSIPKAKIVVTKAPPKK
jgi:predicted ATPase